MGHQKFFGTWKGLVLSRLGGEGLACDAEICFLEPFFARHPHTRFGVSLRYPEKVQNVLRFLPEA
mgnify:CR=1 FL=1